MASVAERVAAARARLQAAGLSGAEAAFDADVLARHVLGWDRARMLADGREPEPEGFAAGLDALIARRARREPVAQIVGRREFWGLDFEVTRDVLIPRPETELIVEEALERIGAGARRVIDVGTGTGCLAVAIAHSAPEVSVVATDVSEAALAVARRNAAAHGVDDRVRFVAADLLQGIGAMADIIVSNPPYVPDPHAAGLQPEVVRYEPGVALFGGASGLDIIDRLLRQAHAHLTPGGRLIMEIGLGQGPDLEPLVAERGWTLLRVRDDLQGIPRTFVLGT